MDIKHIQEGYSLNTFKLDALYASLREAKEAVTKVCPKEVSVGIILGSGLSAVADALEDPITIPYSNIPHMPQSTAPGHEGKLIIGRLNNISVACLQGRVHYYEGYSAQDLVFGTRLLHELGAKTLFITNAAGGIRENLREASLMIIDDHINMLGINPLIGPNPDKLGERFFDMQEVYSKKLRALADEVLTEISPSLPVSHGVYLATSGPSFETPAEIRAFAALGADAVGMSSAPEAIAAKHMGMEVFGISMISNAAAGLSDEVLNAEHTLNNAALGAPIIVDIILGMLKKL